MAESVSTTSRRSFLTSAAKAVAIPGIVTAAAAGSVDPVVPLANEFDIARAAMDEFFRSVPVGASDADYERIFTPVSDLAKRIAATKATSLAGLKGKARALVWCNEEFGFMSGSTTDERLACSLVQDLLTLTTT